MKPHEQRIAIAEACGYEHMPNAAGLMWNHKANRAVITPGSEVEAARIRMKLSCEAGRDTLPDYLCDLNAIHQAEIQCLTTPGSLNEYDSMLCNVTGYARPICADAHERAEALLKTIGKWVEE